jgi:hypothetical protein
MNWDAETLAGIDGTDDLVLVLAHVNGTELRVPVWSAIVDGEVYVRAGAGPTGFWYRRTLAKPEGAVSFGRGDIPVVFEPVAGSAPHAAIEAAYRQKYRRYAPSVFDQLLTDIAVAATVRVRPRG